jgi:hypothetical protein
VNLRLIASLRAFVLCSGCVAQQVEQIAGAQFVNYGDTPASHTVYLGSDGGYHYFAWSDGKTGGCWKVKKEDLVVANQFEVGTREAFLVKGHDGGWCAYPCEQP